MNAARIVHPELLDSLPHEAPEARRSRRDLRIINYLLGNHGWFRRVLKTRLRTGEGVLEVGSGEGELGRALMDADIGPVTGLDLVTCPPIWPERARWIQTSVFEFKGWAAHPVVIGNLVFHHFKDEELGALGAHLNRHARLIVTSEPLRTRRAARFFSALCPVIQADPVTRHDGRVSIEAGFRQDELPRLLGLDPTTWSWRVEETWVGSSRLVAERRAP
jgi:hypothetical protein